ncbi:MAG: hypothetical protein ISP45_12190 [Reyranella sp.]|jgi:hypothetical protein|nr:hypothetical protein [Reyranella sp.]
MTPHTELPRPELPRPELSIGHPEFDAFLSAPVGEDTDGVGLSVMSALARIGLDPWSEAARLSDLPRDAAVEALALSLGQLPPGSWTLAGDLRSLADVARRLADCLPRSHRPVDAPGQPSNAAEPRPAMVAAARKAGGPLAWALYAAIAVGFYLLFSQLQPDHQFEPASRAPTAQQ